MSSRETFLNALNAHSNIKFERLIVTTDENDFGEIHYELHASEDATTPWEMFLFRSHLLDEVTAMQLMLEPVMHEHNKSRTQAQILRFGKARGESCGIIPDK